MIAVPRSTCQSKQSLNTPQTSPKPFQSWTKPWSDHLHLFQCISPPEPRQELFFLNPQQLAGCRFFFFFFLMLTAHKFCDTSIANTSPTTPVSEFPPFLGLVWYHYYYSNRTIQNMPIKKDAKIRKRILS